MTDFVKSKEIKLKNKVSPILSKKDILRQFDEKIKSFLDKKEKYAFQTKELTLKFAEILSDPRLEKGPPDLEFEDQILSRFLAFAQELNEDPDQPNDYGSYALFALLMRSLLKMRNTINKLSIDLENCKYSIDKLDPNRDTNYGTR